MSDTFILFMRITIAASLLSSLYMWVRRFREERHGDLRRRLAHAATGAAFGFALPLVIAVIGYGLGAALTWAVNLNETD